MPEKVKQSFFFYGTLQGQKWKGVKFRSPAFVDNCKLVTANGFPAAVLNSTGVLKGEYVEMEVEQEELDWIMSELDRWETNHNNNPKTSFYLRTNVKVRLPSNREVEALMYYINLNGQYSHFINHNEVIPNGDWLKWIRR